MADFKISLKKQNLLPRVWLRYVYDVFAIIPKDDSQKTLDILNNQLDSIDLICEPENNGTLPFIDVNIYVCINWKKTSKLVFTINQQVQWEQLPTILIAQYNTNNQHITQ